MKRYKITKLKTPEDLILEVIARTKPINAKEAWEEIKKERKLDKNN